MPVGLLGGVAGGFRPSNTAGWGERRGGEGRMMDRSRDLGSCETSIKISKHSEENMHT